MSEHFESLVGIRLTVSAYALEQTNVPVQQHVERRWMRGRAYHRRIQKKWIKRFGWVMKPCIWKTPFGLIVHPALEREVREALT